ncbi:MAG: tandem-95 repeat protein, partial [Pseudomonadota bacterium]
IRGTYLGDTIEGGLGDDALLGGEGGDTYIYSRGDGHDSIFKESDTSGVDVLELRGISPDDLTLEETRTDLVILVAESAPGAGDAGSIFILEQTEGEGIEIIRFDDGTEWNRTQIEEVLRAPNFTDGNDVATTSDADETLEAGQGYDQVDGRGGMDTYVYSRGDGVDILRDTVAGAGDVLDLRGIAPGDITLKRPYGTDDAVLIIAESTPGAGDGGRITLRNTLGGDTIGVDVVRFEDGTEWDEAAMLALLTAAGATDGPDLIAGTDGPDTLAGLGGDDVIEGQLGDDTYLYTRGDGTDVISDTGGSADRIEISGYAVEEVVFERRGYDGTDLVIRLDDLGDEIVVRNAFSNSRYSSAQGRIEEIVLTDSATTFTPSQIAAQILANAGSVEDDIIVGDNTANILEGKEGNDLLVGLSGNDIYRYGAGDGDDRISDTGSDIGDVLELSLTPAEVLFAQRSGPQGLDLIIAFTTGRDRITLEGALTNGRDGVDLIRFSDGTEWDRAQMRAEALKDAEGDGDDRVWGFDSDDTFDGTTGDDILIGDLGSDTYRYSRGEGNDTIIEDLDDASFDTVEFDSFVSSEVSLTQLYKGSDAVVFHFATAPDQTLTVHGAIASDSSGIEQYVFTDGVIWTKAKLLELLDNTAAVATDDGYFAVRETEPLTISADVLLRNDYDPDGDDLRIIAVDGGANGFAELNAAGDVVYTANEGFTGPTQLTYTITDGRNGLSTANVDLRVRPLAEALDDRGFTVEEDGTLIIEVERLLSNDIDGDRLIIGQVRDALNGAVSLSTDGNITFTPNDDFNGQASFTYVANTPEGGVADAVVYIEVTPGNDAPTVRNNTVPQTLENVGFELDPATLLANDFDIDGDTLLIDAVFGNENVRVELTSDGAILVEPRDFYWGSASFDYRVSDGNGGTAIGTVYFYVEPVNNDPEPQADVVAPVEEDQFAIINTADLLANDIEWDGEALTVTSVRSSAGGTVRLLDNDTIEFQPAANFDGTARFFYTVTDGQGGFVSARVEIPMIPENDEPIARADSYQTNPDLIADEDTVLEIDIFDLLANDYDIEDGDLIEFVDVFDGRNGDAVRDGTIIRFTPDENFWGETTFFYNVRDSEGLTGAGEVTVYFNNVDDAPPEANPDSFTLDEDTSIVIPVAAILANDVDIDRDPLTLLGLRFPGPADFPQLNGTLAFNDDGDIVYTPNLNFNGNAQFFYQITDNVSIDGAAPAVVEGQVSLSVRPIPDEPVVVDDLLGLTPLGVPMVLRISDMLSNDTDADRDDVLSFVGLGDGVTLPDNAYVYENEFVVITNAPDFTGETRTIYRISDTSGLVDQGFAGGLVLGSYSGTLTGTNERDLLIGTEAGERIEGLDGDDDLLGEGGDDIFDAGAGDDDIFGGAGNDIILASAGRDTIDGGDDYDIVDYTASNIGVRADLETRVGQAGYADGDVYLRVEELIGSTYADILGGSDLVGDTLRGGLGDDRIEGRGGADLLEGGADDDRLDGGADGDTLDGGEGSDTADYFFSDGAVQVSLADGTAFGGHAEGDTLISIENLIGSDFADTLTGDDGANLLSGGRENDILDGGDGDDTLIGGRGADALIGGLGIDIADYTLSAEGVTIDMSGATAGGGDAEGDTFSGIEIIQGSYHDDTITGDAEDNTIRGGRGADSI